MVDSAMEHGRDCAALAHPIHLHSDRGAAYNLLNDLPGFRLVESDHSYRLGHCAPLGFFSILSPRLAIHGRTRGGTHLMIGMTGANESPAELNVTFDFATEKHIPC